MDAPLLYTIVVPEGQWTFWESANRRGSPAAHAVMAGEPTTLCGRYCEGWQPSPPETDGDITCKPCRRIFNRVKATYEQGL